MKRELLFLITCLLFLVIIKVYTLIFSRRKKNRIKLFFFFSAVLVAFLFNINLGKLNINLFSLPCGILAGSLFFLLSLFITTSNFKGSFQFIRESCKNILLFIKSNLFLSLRRFFTSFIEEMFWRVLLINLLSKNILKDKVITAILVSICFTLDHFPQKRRKTIFREWFDLFIFSLNVSVLYILTRDIILISVIHFLRNINIDMYLFGSFTSTKVNKRDKRPFAIVKKILYKLKEEECL